MSTRRLDRKDSAERGVVVLEAALTLLALCVVLFAVIESSRFLGVYQIVTDAAVEGARFAITPLSGTSTLPSQAEIIDKWKQKIQTGTNTAQDKPINYNTSM